MGVAVARGLHTRASLAPRASDRRIRSRRRGGQTDPSPRLVPTAAWWVGAQRKTFWGRMEDDRELIRFKVLLLTSLLLLAAVLEWVA